VPQEIQGDIDFILESNRCSLDLKVCENYGIVNYKGLCQKFSDKTAIFSGFFSGFKPTLRCPVKPGNYTMDEISFDLAIIAMLPIDGSIWYTNTKLIASQNGSKKKKILLCMNSETKIIKFKKP